MKQMVGKLLRLSLGDSRYYRLVNSVLSPFVRIPNPMPRFPADLTAQEAYHLRYREMQAALTHAVYFSNVLPGDIAEFGTATGFTARCIANAMRHVNTKKKFYLFDSFEGLPRITSTVDKSCPEVMTNTWAEHFMKELSEYELRAQLLQFIDHEQVVTVPGWFADTVPKLINCRFSFIHFDGDLYQSTIDAFDVLFSQGMITKPALICFDDWNCGEANPEFGERKAWSELVTKYNIQYEVWKQYAIECLGFIVHSYGAKK